ncbi:hypothetical protein DFH07DRAFT_962035 [Mycena maculata]|uniref:Uncharacterized protein n=1 Tax=Mycena maculata TaxID=230809 RepID=A0AAD7IR95_9AGAR|nr:hypothetical protein DFH07DRAFT_962035 [Mycena maculata]
MSGVWLPVTHSGNEFSPFTLGHATLPKLVTMLQEPTFGIGPLIAQAVAAESESQDDHEDNNDAPNDHNPLNDMDNEWPPRQPLDPR